MIDLNNSFHGVGRLCVKVGVQREAEKKNLLNVNFQPLKLKLLTLVEKKFSKLLVFKKRNRTLSPPEVSMVSFNNLAINKYIKMGFEIQWTLIRRRVTKGSNDLKTEKLVYAPWVYDSKTEKLCKILFIYVARYSSDEETFPDLLPWKILG